MAHRSSKINWVRLSAAPQWADGTNGDFDTIDLSSYVDPLHSKAFKVVTASIQIMPSDSFGLAQDTGTNNMSIGMQIVTGTQSTMISPKVGKLVYHKFASYVNDPDSTVRQWQQYEFKVADLWPDGYFVVIDSLTCGVQSTADFTADDLRIVYTVTGYQVSVSSNQLASLLVAQTN